MTLLDKIREEKLIRLAMTHFRPNLSPAELRVLHDSASSEDLPDPDENAPRPEVRADFLRWLATDPDTAPHIDSKGLRVYAATISGKLDLEECHVKKTMVMQRCNFQGNINLISAETKGIHILDSSLSGGLWADRVIIHGPLCLQRVLSEGEIRLNGAWIEGELDCNGAMLNAKGVALNLDGVKVTLNLEGAKIDSDVFLRDPFETLGTVRLLGTRISGQLDFRGAKLAKVVCRNMQVADDLMWMGIREPENAALDLTGARVKNLRDDKESWPVKGKLILDGLFYEEATQHVRPSDEEIAMPKLSEELPLNVRERVHWLNLQPEDTCRKPQPWMQLRDLLERKGDSRGAKYVLRRFRCLQAQKSWIPWRWLKKGIALLEENPLLIGCLIALTLVLGTFVYAGAARSGAMIETVTTQPNMIASYFEIVKDAPRKPDESIKPVSVHYTSFQPFIYTLENAVPLVKLGMDERWMPDPQHQPRPWFPKDGRLDGLKWFNSYSFLVWFRWLLILWGWVQATILAASVADRFRK